MSALYEIARIGFVVKRFQRRVAAVDVMGERFDQAERHRDAADRLGPDRHAGRRRIRLQAVAMDKVAAKSSAFRVAAPRVVLSKIHQTVRAAVASAWRRPARQAMESAP